MLVLYLLALCWACGHEFFGSSVVLKVKLHKIGMSIKSWKEG